VGRRGRETGGNGGEE
jgi:hypothetical protein